MLLTIYTATTMIVLAYLLGSIPSAVWIGKKYYGIDIREHGSKNAGTTNMLRVLGRRAAAPVFALDFLKGFVAVTVIELLQYDELIGPNDIINLKIAAVVEMGETRGGVRPEAPKTRAGPEQREIPKTGNDPVRAQSSTESKKQRTPGDGPNNGERPRQGETETGPAGPAPSIRTKYRNGCQRPKRV